MSEPPTQGDVTEPRRFDAEAWAWILRDPKESPAKCSLTPIRQERPAGVDFLNFDVERTYDVDGAVLLHCDGEPLSARDRDRPLLLLDGSWRRVAPMFRRLEGAFEQRSIPPGFQTAYPRRSKTFEDPSAGLASIEALYIAGVALGHRDDSLLVGYRWSSEFLAANREALARLERLAAEA